MRIMSGKRNPDFVPEIGWSDIPFRKYLASRIVTPVEIVRTLRNNDTTDWSIGELIFFARYEAGKAIEGLDYVFDEIA